MRAGLLGLGLILAGCTANIPIAATLESTPEPSAAPTYTMAQVAEHANPPADCWIVLHGKVYNVSNFSQQHPGGEAIYQGCGNDATAFFENRPKDNSSHSAEARQLAETFLIGTVAE